MHRRKATEEQQKTLLKPLRSRPYSAKALARGAVEACMERYRVLYQSMRRIESVPTPDPANAPWSRSVHVASPTLWHTSQLLGSCARFLASHNLLSQLSYPTRWYRDRVTGRMQMTRQLGKTRNSLHCISLEFTSQTSCLCACHEMPRENLRKQGKLHRRRWLARPT